MSNVCRVFYLFIAGRLVSSEMLMASESGCPIEMGPFTHDVTGRGGGEGGAPCMTNCDEGG